MDQAKIMVVVDKKGVWLAVLCAVLFFAQGFFGNQHKSLTWDEPSFISAGYAYLKWGDFQLNPSHPPLMQDIEALPLLFMDLKVPEQNHPSWRQSVNPVVAFGHQFFFKNGNDFHKMGFWARLPVLLLGSFLILSMYLWGRELLGSKPALLATFLAALSPNLLAHAKVATEDLGCTTLMFVSIWALWVCLRKNWFRNWIICGFATGLALISKYTAMLLGPIYLLLIAGFWWRDRSKKNTLNLLMGLCVVVILASVIIGASYNFSFDFSYYLKGLRQIYGDYSPYKYSYLWGMFSEKPISYYYVAAFLVKVPVPIILLIVFAAFTFLRTKGPGEVVSFLLIPAAVIIAISFFDRHNLGIRRILPAFPFLYLFAGGILTGAVIRMKTLFVVVMACWMAFESWNIFPHHLSYFNTVAGGPRKGPYLLDDSNIDWGQDLPSLAAWQKGNLNGKPIKLFYFGTADPIGYGVKSLYPENSEILQPQSGYYAVSVHKLVWFRSLQRNRGLDVDWLTKYKPVALMGNSIYIYKFP